MHSENRYKVLNSVPRLLCDTLGDPRQVPDLLLLELEVSVEHAVLELLQERQLVVVHLRDEELVLQLRRDAEVPILVRAGARRAVEKRTVLRDAFADRAHLVDVICFCELVVSLGEEAADGRKEARALFLGELCVERVDRDVDRAPVGLERENARHDVGRWTIDGCAEGVEVFEVGFVERVADDFDVEVVEVRGREAVTEVWC